MQKRNWLISTVLATSLFTVGAMGTAAAGGCGGGPGGGGYGYNSRVLDRLDLSKEQRQSIWNIMDEQRDAMRANRDEMVEIRKSLREAVKADTYDEATVQQLANKKAQLMTEMTVQRTANMHRIRKLLTAEQLTQLDEMEQRFSKRRGRY